MNERSFRPIIQPELPERPRIPEIESMESALFEERPDLANARREMEQILDSEQLNRERLNNWVEIWNRKEQEQRGFQGPTGELSGTVSPRLRHGKLRYFLFPETRAVKIGYHLHS